eukprot:305407-Chlamydomonas_euryale.AAC.1
MGVDAWVWTRGQTHAIRIQPCTQCLHASPRAGGARSLNAAQEGTEGPEGEGHTMQLQREREARSPRAAHRSSSTCPRLSPPLFVPTTMDIRSSLPFLQPSSHHSALPHPLTSPSRVLSPRRH